MFVFAKVPLAKASNRNPQEHTGAHKNAGDCNVFISKKTSNRNPLEPVETHTNLCCCNGFISKSKIGTHRNP